MESLNLLSHRELMVQQIFEAGELFGFETRNKYLISGAGGAHVGYAAEQQKGVLGFLLRQFLGHWRSFDVHVFDRDRKEVCVAHHPFRFYFSRIEIYDMQQQFLGSIQKRFSIFTKRFDVEDENGNVLFEVASPFWKIWTFPILHMGQQYAVIRKKWSGIFAEGFTDKDRFEVCFENAKLSEKERLLLLVTSIFVDLLYFERKAR